MIKPTIGRVVLVYRLEADSNPQWEQASICYVHSDTCINVAGTDMNGVPFALTYLELRQGDVTDDAIYIPDSVMGRDNFACWMPYQRKAAGV